MGALCGESGDGVGCRLWSSIDQCPLVGAIGIGVADWRLLRDTADEASLLHAFQLRMRSCCQFLRYSSERRRWLLTFDMLSEKSVWGQLPTKDCMRWFSDVNTDLYNLWHMR